MQWADGLGSSFKGYLICTIAKVLREQFQRLCCNNNRTWKRYNNQTNCFYTYVNKDKKEEVDLQTNKANQRTWEKVKIFFEVLLISNLITTLARVFLFITIERAIWWPHSCHDSSLIFTLESIKSVALREVISCEDRTRILSSCSVLTQRICDRWELFDLGMWRAQLVVAFWPIGLNN